MKALSRFLISMITSVGLSLIGFWFLPVIFKEKIEVKLSELSGGMVRLDKVGWVLMPYQGIYFKNVQFQHSSMNMDATVEEIALTLPILQFYKNKEINLDLWIKTPKIKKVLRPSVQEEDAAKAPRPLLPIVPAMDIKLPYIIRVKAHMADGEILVTTIEPGVTNPVVSLKKTDLSIDVESLKRPVQINLQTEASFGAMAWMGTIPVKMKSALSYVFEDTKLSSAETDISIWGLPISLKGQSILGTVDHSWTVSLSIPDLTKLPRPQNVPLLKSWSGAMVIRSQLQQLGVNPLKLYADVEMKNSRVDIAGNFSDLDVQGALAFNGNVRIFGTEKWQGSANVLINADQLTLKKEGLLSKNSGTPMSLSLQGGFQKDAASISESKLKLAQLEVLTTGKFDFSNRGLSADVKIPTTNLEGIEKIFPLIQSYPLKGRISLDSQIEGSLNDLEHWAINIKPLRLSGLEAYVNYAKDDLHVAGPVRADASIDAHLRASQILSAMMSLSLDGTKLYLKKGDLFLKKQGDKLELNLSANQNGDSIRIQKGQITLPAGQVNLFGQLKKPLQPEFAFTLETTPLQHNSIGQWLPAFRNEIPQGQTQLRIQASGNYDFKKGLETSPITLNGNLTSNFPNLKIPEIKSSTPTAGSPTTAANTAAVAKAPLSKETAKPVEEPKSYKYGVIPPWPIFQFSKMQWTVNAANVSYENQRVQGLSFNGLYDKGTVLTSLRSPSFFGGRLEVSKVRLVLNQNPILFEISSLIEKVEAGPPIHALMPDLKSMFTSLVVTSKLDGGGAFDLEKGIDKSPIAINGFLKAESPMVKITPPPESKNPPPPAPDAKDSKPLLPDWPLFKKSQFQWDVTLNQFNYGPYQLQGLSSKGNVDKGQLFSNAKVAQVFGGSVDVAKIGMNLQQSPALVSFHGNAQNLKLSPLLTNFLPEYKDFAEGNLSAQFNGSLPFPWGNSLISALQLEAQQSMKDAVMKGAPIFDMVKEKLSKIPGIGGQQGPADKDVRLEQSAQLNMKNGELEFKQFRMIDTHRNEVRADGNFSLNTKSVNLVGNTFMADAPVKGSFKEANQDNTGRLVIPMKISGTLKNLDYNLTDETLKPMLQKAVQYELENQKKKIAGQITDQAQQKLESEKKKVEEQLKSEAEKKIKDLLGK